MNRLKSIVVPLAALPARAWAEMLAVMARRDLHVALWLCVPGLVLAALVRFWLCWNIPCATFLSDTRNFVSAAEVIGDAPWKVVGGSRTFLMSALYAIPLALDQPVLPWAPWGAHAVGLLMVLASGLLCFGWFRFWRFLIMPVTALVAVNPVMLSWEHMALPETLYVTAVLWVAVAVALFVKRPGVFSFGGVLSAVFLAAGARQEGFLLLGAAALAVAAAFWRAPVRLVRYGCVWAAFAAGTSMLSATSQGGQMLLASMIHMAPERLKSAPDFSGRAVALRELFRPQWPLYPDEHNKSRRVILGEVKSFLMSERGMDERAARRENNSFCKRVGIEIALRNLPALPPMVANKFLATHTERPAHEFDSFAPGVVKQMFGAPGNKEFPFMKRLFGIETADSEAFRVACETRFYRAATHRGLNAFQQRWIRLTRQQPADEEIPKLGPPDHTQPLPRLPWIYAAALAGFCLCLLVDTRARTAMAVWLMASFGLWFAITIVGSLRARYRLVWEPQWILGLAALANGIAVAAILARGAWRRLRSARS